MVSKILLFILIAIQAIKSDQKIMLDTNADKSGAWLDVTCHYADDYQDFSAYGCPSSPSVEIYPELTGFWTPCGAQTCEIIYNAGALPKPIKLSFTTFIEGADSGIRILGKAKEDDATFNLEIGSLKADAKWSNHEIDISTLSQLAVLNFTITSGPSGGLALLDKIVVDFDPSTSVPSVNLDKESDQVGTYWVDQNCHYMEDYSDLWVYGCPMEQLAEDDKKSGYWNPCRDTSCTLQYFNSMPSGTVTVRSYIEGTGEIIITRQKRPGMTAGMDSKEVLRISATGQEWQTGTLPSYPEEDHVLNFKLVSGSNGTVLLDWINVDTKKTNKNGANSIVMSTFALVLTAFLYFAV